MTTALRPLSLGELLDRTFFLYRNHFALFATIVGLPGLVTLTINLAAQPWLRPPVGATPQQLLASFGMTALFSLVLLFPALIVAALSHAATIVAVSRIQLDQPVTVTESFSAIRGRVFSIALMIAAVGVLVFLGCLLFIVPGVVLALRWSLVIPAAVLENENLGGAMSRSSILTDGHHGRILAIYALYAIMLLAVGALVQGGLTLALGLAGVPRGALAQPLWAHQLLTVAGFFVGAVVGPVLTIAFSLVYYDERVRKEAFDVQHLLSQLPAVDPVTS